MSDGRCRRSWALAVMSFAVSSFPWGLTWPLTTTEQGSHVLLNIRRLSRQSCIFHESLSSIEFEGVDLHRPGLNCTDSDISLR